LSPEGLPLLYLERQPAPPLDRFIRVLWYSSAPEVDHRRERVLPTGCSQVILNLARDFLLDCPDVFTVREAPPAQVVGARSVYDVIDTSDLADLIGVVFRPGGFPAFAAAPADQFANLNLDLESLWGSAARSLRDNLRELPTPQGRLDCFESFLRHRLLSCPSRSSVPSHAAVQYALTRFPANSVREVAQATGWSERRFSQVFREQVGLAPKVWCRVQRFQRAVRRLRAEVPVPFTTLALECGFYDQSHFANEFRAFSGIDMTAYVNSQATRWTNHVPTP